MIAVIGAGPAGCYYASLVRGRDVHIFEDHDAGQGCRSHAPGYSPIRSAGSLGTSPGSWSSAGSTASSWWHPAERHVRGPGQGEHDPRSRRVRPAPARSGFEQPCDGAPRREVRRLPTPRHGLRGADQPRAIRGGDDRRRGRTRSAQWRARQASTGNARSSLAGRRAAGTRPGARRHGDQARAGRFLLDRTGERDDGARRCHRPRRAGPSAGLPGTAGLIAGHRRPERNDPRPRSGAEAA